nr:protein kinase [Negativicutes bacterium]
MNPNGLLDDRYRLLERIGGGGMAEVFLAEDVLLARQVAVKLLRAQFTGDEDFVAKFRQEARAAARLSHPNIVSIYDVGCEADTHYIVMEYVPGETLK